MANALCFSCVNSISCPAKSCIPPSVLSPVSSISFQNPSPHLHPPKPAAGRASSSRFHSLKATDSDQTKSTKINSIVCADCEGNGAILCTQCKGNGVNSVDHFNGQFKAGALCWLCRGKREILCGNCNGAGFMGGFMSTFDE